MESSLIYTCLAVLAILVALNLKLTLHLFELVRNPSILNPPFLAREIGEPIPALTGQSLANTTVELSDLKQAAALLFLSSRCPQCQEKLSEIAALTPLLEEAGLTMWLVTNEPKRHFAKFLNNGPLQEHVILLDKGLYKQINPTLSTPYYLFINHLTQLEAGGVIGDDNWQSFLQQMDDIRQQGAVA